MTDEQTSNDAPMIQYRGVKEILARPMTRGEYNEYRGWALPADENPNDAGYLVEYTDGGKPNHEAHEGYISWSPADVFEKAYRPSATWLDRLRIERDELAERKAKLEAFFRDGLANGYGSAILEDQHHHMRGYLMVLDARLGKATDPTVAE